MNYLAHAASVTPGGACAAMAANAASAFERSVGPESARARARRARPGLRARRSSVRDRLPCEWRCATSWRRCEARCGLWGLATDERNLRIAVARVTRNRGSRTAGVDGLTMRKVLINGVDAFVADARTELRSGAYRPSPVRRAMIPKNGRPGEFRALGIPTVRDRVVQAALKNILEPVFEADFYPTSYGFRPGRSAHAALEHLRCLLRPREA